MNPIRVAIIGAGPAGLTLARVLLHQASLRNIANAFNVQVYEKDASPNMRQQGGSLDLHPKAGLLALEQGGLLDKFWAKARPEGQDLRIRDKNDQVHLEHVAEEGKAERPEIDRTDLRNLLLESLSPSTVQWGHKLLSISPSGLSSAPYTLTFDNRTAVEADVVVGAEGAWSKVRNLLTDVKPVYTGITVVELCLSDIDKRHPDLAKYVGRGSVFVFSEGKGIQAQRVSTGAVRAYASFSVPATWASETGIASATPDDVRTKLLEMFADWNSTALDIIRKCDDDHLIPRALYALPVSAEEAREKEGKWAKHFPGVTLIGDAAHLTGPSGKGVNYAMLDALQLANGLLGMKRGAGNEQKEEIAKVVEEYQKELFPRCREAGIGAEKNLSLKYMADAPISIVAFFKRAHGGK